VPKTRSEELDAREEEVLKRETELEAKDEKFNDLKEELCNDDENEEAAEASAASFELAKHKKKHHKKQNKKEHKKHEKLVEHHKDVNISEQKVDLANAFIAKKTHEHPRKIAADNY
jgi:hypothetical protein